MGNPIEELQNAVRDLKEQIARVEADAGTRFKDVLQPAITDLTTRIAKIETDAASLFKKDRGWTKNEAFAETSTAAGVLGEATGVKLEGRLADVSAGLFKVEFVKWDLDKILEERREKRRLSALQQLPEQLDLKALAARNVAEDGKRRAENAMQRANQAWTRAGLAKSIADGAKGRADHAMREVKALYGQADVAGGAIKRLRHEVEVLNTALGR
ncbi:hypothetical protein [Phytohabitans rumicis]|uniref:Uncharacterized protein n=1 Tax=Phytohabitans rumicis TaxID=1076125 RepID=A0A6V8LT94_9ACTN|nr:hypothetical protein [Phytohabitans rumicis]GFJ95975.1 hypothetical protein Prum_096170 [Phytohabitans rumicis]